MTEAPHWDQPAAVPLLLLVLEGGDAHDVEEVVDYH